MRKSVWKKKLEATSKRVRHAESNLHAYEKQTLWLNRTRQFIYTGLSAMLYFTLPWVLPSLSGSHRVLKWERHKIRSSFFNILKEENSVKMKNSWIFFNDPLALILWAKWRAPLICSRSKVIRDETHVAPLKTSFATDSDLPHLSSPLHNFKHKILKVFQKKKFYLNIPCHTQ